MNTDLNKLVQAKYCELLFSTHFLKQSCGSEELLWTKPWTKKKNQPRPKPKQRRKKGSVVNLEV